MESLSEFPNSLLSILDVSRTDSYATSEQKIFSQALANFPCEDMTWSDANRSYNVIHIIFKNLAQLYE